MSERVRHKRLGIELDVKRRGVNVYLETAGGSLIHKDDPEWEIIPEEVWVDVTAECNVTPAPWPSSRFSAANGIMDKDGFMLWVCHENRAKGYRLRKIAASVMTVKPDLMDPSASCVMVNEHKDVFIVERRKAQP